MAAAQLMLPANRAFDSNGFPEAGATVKLYQSGTTTPANFYADNALTIALGSTLVANSAGRLVTVAYQDTSTPFRLKVFAANGDELDDIDPYYFGLNTTANLPNGATVVSRIALSSVTNPANGQSAILSESGREGTFVFSTDDLSAEVTADPLQGIYVAPSTDTTGASGAWVREATTITPFIFGAVGDGATNDLVALQAMSDFFFNDGTVFYDYYADFSGNFAVSGKLSIGPSAANDRNARRYNVGGDLRLVQKTASFETCYVRNLGTTSWQGGINVKGVGGTTFASRTCAIGITLNNCAMARFDHLKAFNFWLWGVWNPSSPTEFNDEAGIGLVRCFWCGSGHAGGTLAANWSAPVNSGTSGSTGQRTTITVDALPASAIETYETPGFNQIQVRIAGYLYFVYSWDRVANTISIYPWLDNTSFAAGTGTLDWVIGGAFGTDGPDSGVMQIDHLNANTCGRGLGDGGAYGTRIGSANMSTCGTAVAIGAPPNAAHIGTCIDALYTENNTEDVVLVSGCNAGAWNYINSGYNVNPAKCWSTADARLTGGTFGNEGGALGADHASAGVNTPTTMTLPVNGRILRYHGRPLTNLLTNVATFRDHATGPRIYTQNVNSQTVTLAVVGTGEYNRLFGYRGSTWRYVGTGTAGAPIGSFTFTPPAGGTVNGGAINASTTFSGPFDGPVDFEILHTDTAQLTWLVRLVAGQSRQNVGAFGYSPGGGAGSTATQVTSKSTAVTLNRVCGAITMSNAALAGGTAVSFTFNNTQIGADDYLHVWVKSGFATAATYRARSEGNASGSRTIVLENVSAGSLSEAVVIGFTLVKSAVS